MPKEDIIQNRRPVSKKKMKDEQYRCIVALVCDENQAHFVKNIVDRFDGLDVFIDDENSYWVGEQGITKFPTFLFIKFGLVADKIQGNVTFEAVMDKINKLQWLPHHLQSRKIKEERESKNSGMQK